MDTKNKLIAFDLDDTLIYEIDFLKSAYQEIAKHISPSSSLSLYQDMMVWYYKGINVFDRLCSTYSHISKDKILRMYRCHKPSLQLNAGALDVLLEFKQRGYSLGLITDGRSITQRNKIKALGVESLFNKIIISEEFGSTKYCAENFKIFHNKDLVSYYYIGDNIKKDFYHPNLLGWTSICLLNKGWNIHKQNFDTTKEYLPKYKIKELLELLEIID